MGDLTLWLASIQWPAAVVTAAACIGAGLVVYATYVERSRARRELVANAARYEYLRDGWEADLPGLAYIGVTADLSSQRGDHLDALIDASIAAHERWKKMGPLDSDLHTKEFTR